MGEETFYYGIKSIAGPPVSFGGTNGDQWKEFFYGDAIDKDVLVVQRERKRRRWAVLLYKKRLNDNIISSGFRNCS